MPPDNKGGDSSELKAGCKEGIFRSAGCRGFTVATATAMDVSSFGQQNRREYERSSSEFHWQERLCSNGSVRIAAGCRLRATTDDGGRTELQIGQKRLRTGPGAIRF